MLDYSTAQIERLVKKAQEGNKASFEELFKIFFDRIYRYVSFRVPNETTEDLTGDVFLKVVKGLKKYKSNEISGFSTWIFRVAHNTIIDYYRKKKELLGLLDEDGEEILCQLPDEESLSPFEETQKKFDYQKLHQALEKIKPAYREILELKFLEGFSNTEISQITGKTEGNIRIIQLRALKEIREYFEV